MDETQSFLEEVARLAVLQDDGPKAMQEMNFPSLGEFIVWKLAVGHLMRFLCECGSSSGSSVMKLPHSPRTRVMIELVRNSPLGVCLEYDEDSNLIRYKTEVTEETIPRAHALVVDNAVIHKVHSPHPAETPDRSS